MGNIGIKLLNNNKIAIDQSKRVIKMGNIYNFRVQSGLIYNVTYYYSKTRVIINVKKVYEMNQVIKSALLLPIFDSIPLCVSMSVCICK